MKRKCIILQCEGCKKTYSPEDVGTTEKVCSTCKDREKEKNAQKRKEQRKGKKEVTSSIVNLEKIADLYEKV